MLWLHLFQVVDGLIIFIFFFSSRRRHTRFDCDWSSDVCSSDLSQKFVTTKAPYAPSNGKRRLGASSKLPLMTSTPRPLSALAAAPTGSRLTTRTVNLADASNASTTPPPCFPLPPITAITGFAIVCSPCRVSHLSPRIEKPQVQNLASAA